MQVTSVPVAWRLAWPLRQYFRFSPLRKGKGFLLRNLLVPLLPPAPAEFLATLPGGGRLVLQYREALGISTLLDNGFETREIECLRSIARRGATVMDVGANVGVFTISLAQAVGPSGKVIAFEPLPLNVERLKSNIALNHLDNIHVYELALGEREGELTLQLARDGAFVSAVEVSAQQATGYTITAPVSRLDAVWQGAGSPDVALVKVDVEGAELAVLAGSEALLASCKPDLLLEANTQEHLEALVSWLSVRGYRRSQPRGFKPWNHLFSGRN